MFPDRLVCELGTSCLARSWDIGKKRLPGILSSLCLLLVYVARAMSGLKSTVESQQIEKWAWESYATQLTRSGTQRYILVVQTQEA